MPWVKLDDQFPHHPRVVAAGDMAAWLYVAGLCYAGQFLTDGIVPKAQIRRLTNLRRPELEAQRLVAAGLWSDLGDGYEIHDYHQYNPPAEKVKAKREADRVRKESARNPDGHPVGVAAESRGRSTPNSSPTPKGPKSPSDSGNAEPDEGGETTSQSEPIQVQRLLRAVRKRGPEVESEARDVVRLARKHLDWRLVDEGIGYMHGLDKTPDRPVYLLELLNDWAPKRGIVVPELRLYPAKAAS